MLKGSGEIRMCLVVAAAVASSVVLSSSAFAHDSGHDDWGHDNRNHEVDRRVNADVDIRFNNRVYYTHGRKAFCIPQWTVDRHGNIYQEEDCY